MVRSSASHGISEEWEERRNTRSEIEQMIFRSIFDPHIDCVRSLETSKYRWIQSHAKTNCFSTVSHFALVDVDAKIQIYFRTKNFYEKKKIMKKKLIILSFDVSAWKSNDAWRISVRFSLTFCARKLRVHAFIDLIPWILVRVLPQRKKMNREHVVEKRIVRRRVWRRGRKCFN